MSMRSVYRKVARKNGVSVKEVKEEMQKAIDAAWDRTDKPAECVRNQNTFLPTGEKPSVEEFICVAAEKMKQK